jgi:hypothetical protein
MAQSRRELPQNSQYSQKPRTAAAKGRGSKVKLVAFSEEEEGQVVFQEKMYQSLLEEKADSFKDEFKKHYQELFGGKTSKEIGETEL